SAAGSPVPFVSAAAPALSRPPLMGAGASPLGPSPAVVSLAGVVPSGLGVPALPRAAGDAGAAGTSVPGAATIGADELPPGARGGVPDLDSHPATATAAIPPQTKISRFMCAAPPRSQPTFPREPFAFKTIGAGVGAKPVRARFCTAWVHARSIIAPR